MPLKFWSSKAVNLQKMQFKWNFVLAIHKINTFRHVGWSGLGWTHGRDHFCISYLEWDFHHSISKWEILITTLTKVINKKGVGGGHLNSWCIFSFQSWDLTLPINRLSQGIHDMTQISIIYWYMKRFKWTWMDLIAILVTSVLE
jgi:hypothetical protein